MNLHKHVWTEGLQMDDFRIEGTRNAERLQQLVGLSEGYEKRVKEETELTKDQLKTRYVGKVDPKKASGGCRSAAHRGQHRLCFKTDD